MSLAKRNKLYSDIINKKGIMWQKKYEKTDSWLIKSHTHNNRSSLVLQPWHGPDWLSSSDY